MVRWRATDCLVQDVLAAPGSRSESLRLDICLHTSPVVASQKCLQTQVSHRRMLILLRHSSSLLTLALLLPSAHGFLTADTRNGKLPHAITPARTAASQSNACPSIDQHKRPPPQLDTSSFSTTFDAADDTAAVDTYTPPNLSGMVAIVTGASRGIGKGIALELGKAGMKVYVTGRSSRATGVSTERDLGPANTDAPSTGRPRRSMNCQEVVRA